MTRTHDPGDYDHHSRSSGLRRGDSMEAIATNQFFHQLGITQSRNSFGETTWTINIVVDQGGAQTRSAYFDEELGKWKLERARKQQPLAVRSKSDTVLPKPQSTCSLQEPDWTKDLYLSDHVELFRSQDWAASPLGHHSTWSHSLRLYTHMLFSDSRPAAIYWGPKRIAIYNEHSSPLIGDLHPILMGRSFEEVMPNLWDFFGPLFHAIEKDQHGFARNSLEVPLVRNCYLEETWWDGGLVSLKDDDGNHGGVYFSWVEVTRTILRDRRTVLINQLGQASLASTESIWQHIYGVFKEYPLDIPMAVIYSTDQGSSGNKVLLLEHTIGIGPAYAAAPNHINLSSTDTDSLLVPLLRRSMKTSDGVLVIDSKEEQLDQSLFNGIEWLGFGEPSRYLVILSLRARGVVKGHIVFGLNPRREYDDDHKQFVMDLARQLREIATRVTAEEEAQMRQDQLLMRLGDTERRMSRLAEIAPVGMYDFAPTGEVMWANSHFYDILGVPQKHRGLSFVWKDYILPEDHDRSDKEMARSLIDGVGISGSIRTRRRYTPPRTGHNNNPEDEPFWIMYNTSPDFAEDGSVQSLKGSLSDISHLKWTEQLHIRNAEVALRARRRQEEFIDITSHEMRNPLSAITQCADSVISSYQEAKDIEDAQSLVEIIKLSAEAAESILLCAAHQRRIIDDILTLGKLDSELLTICPMAFHPSDVLNQAANMFKTEFEVNKIEAKTIVDPACTLASSSTVYGDSSRLMQILINLVTNAIKFTRARQARNVTIRFGSSQQAPPTNVFGAGFDWHSTGATRPDLTQEPDYGQGEEIYLYFAVVDSGIGIPFDYKDKVFSKFEQAERRSHTKYGGSGLGLYISRELAEMQGGRIGISSEDGVGSTFAFYTKARLAESTDPTAAICEATHSAPITLSVITQSTTPTPSSLPPLSATYSILLVEDNLLNQRILAKQLTKAGCTVRVSSNGAEAIDTMLSLHNLPPEFGTTPQPPCTMNKGETTYFDCILMDWEMPICDGLSATRRIRDLEKSLGCKRNVIIGITANARAEQIKMAIEAGMDSVVSKPFRVREILETIGKLVGAASERH